MCAGEDLKKDWLKSHTVGVFCIESVIVIKSALDIVQKGFEPIICQTKVLVLEVVCMQEGDHPPRTKQWDLIISKTHLRRVGHQKIEGTAAHIAKLVVVLVH